MGRFSEIEELACSDAGCYRSAQSLDIEAMRTQHPISWNNKVNFATKTLLH